MRVAVLLAALLAVLAVSVEAKVCGTKGAKTFQIKKNKFVDVGAQGGYAQRAFLDVAGQVTDALREEGLIGPIAKLFSYKLIKGCYKTLIRKGTKNLVGEYEFKYTVVYNNVRPNGSPWKDYFEVNAVAVFNRGKVLLKGKAEVVELLGKK